MTTRTDCILKFRYEAETLYDSRVCVLATSSCFGSAPQAIGERGVRIWASFMIAQ